jgi:hypothetical protein
MGTDRASVLIGVDGGATEVKVHEVEALRGQPELLLRAGKGQCSKRYGKIYGFAPLTLEEQRAQLAAPVLSELERQQGLQWVEAVAECIAVVAAAREGSAARIGVALPGLKTPDGRGIALSLHGPRIPDFLDRLEERLAKTRVRSAAPIGRLLSDGECCGLGEQYAEGGAFRDVEHAYYLGGGTGLAESLKLAGEVVPLERIESWFPKAWQLDASPKDALEALFWPLKPSPGQTFDSLLSVAELNRRYAESPPKSHGHSRKGFVEGRIGEDPCAIAQVENLAHALAVLVERRVRCLEQPAQGPEHDPRPIRLQRVVVGQRLGQLFADERTIPYLADYASLRLARQIPSYLDPTFVDRGPEPVDLEHPPSEGRELARFLVPSSLRAAPAIGAAASTLLER